MSPGPGPATRTAAWLALVAGLGAALHLMGTGGLAAPPVRSLDGLAAWVGERDPATTAVALVRFGAELTAWYLLGLSVVQVAAARSRSRGVGRLADALALPGARHLVRSGLGLGLLAATAGGADPAGPGATTATMRPLPTGTGEAVTQVAEPGTAWMTPRPAAPDADGDDRHDGDDDRDGAAPRADPRGPGPAVRPVPVAWRVEPGESFWSIAADVLAEAWGRPPTDAEIDPYWRSVVEHNRDRLLDPADADLIVPGQRFELPAPPAAPAVPAATPAA